MNTYAILIATMYWLMAGLALSEPVTPAAPVKKAAPARSANLELAKTYQQLKKWPEAEKYFQEAAKEDDPSVGQAALLGIRQVRQAADAESPDLAGAQYYYKHADVPEKAEDQYVAALKSNSPSVRDDARKALEEVQASLWVSRAIERVNSWSKNVTTLLATIAGIVSIVFAIFSIVLFVRESMRIRRSVEFSNFTEVGEKAQGKMAFWLAYIRARLRALSRVPPSRVSDLIASPPMLYIALPDFRDELPEPDEQVDFGGTKIPLAFFVGHFAKPKVKVVGGWTAPASPAEGSAFASVFRRSDANSADLYGFVTRPIKAPTPDADLEAFAYDIYVKVVEANAP